MAGDGGVEGRKAGGLVGRVNLWELMEALERGSGGETNGAIDVFLAYVRHVGAVDGFVCVHFEGCE